MAYRETICEKCGRRIEYVGSFRQNPVWAHVGAGSHDHVAVPVSCEPWQEPGPVYSVQLPLCPLPPPGWICTRGAGHDGQGGPCAAIPLPSTVRLLPAVPQPGQNSCTKKQGEARE